LCHFLHILAVTRIADRTVQQHPAQELRHIAEELDQLADDTTNESDQGPISFSPRWRNPGD
jgi:hypothetical protein